jgi:hypothetical protein
VRQRKTSVDFQPDNPMGIEYFGYTPAAGSAGFGGALNGEDFDKRCACSGGGMF